MAPQPVLLDVDTGIDDSLALLYAVASDDCDLVAVTCVSGNIEARQVTVNTRSVLELAGRADIEVAIGRETPLVRPLSIAPDTHGPQGLGYARLPTPSAEVSDRFGPDVIVAEASRRPGELMLVTVGPLTNLALAVLQEPDLPKLVRRWVLMGGAYRVPGNVSPTTEWNVHCDPEAAKICFGAWTAAAKASGGAVTRPLALGLDVTEKAKMTPDHVVALARRAGSTPREDLSEMDGSVASNPVVRYIADALRFYMEFHSRFDGFYGAFIHDALALAAALDPSLVRSEPVTVDVELGGTLTAGQTVTDWRRTWGRPPNVDVAVQADSDRFMRDFVERVGGLAARRASVAS